MRSEQEIFSEILQFAKEDNNIDIAVLNGSRVNPNAPRDFMQDYDVRVYVKDLDAAYIYKAKRSWISRFGDLVMLQQNNFEDGSFIFLLQYKDSIRIDLSFQAKEMLEIELKEDSLSKIILDKNNEVKVLPEPSDTTYFTKCPTETEWNETLNELWWLQGYIGKELWRNEIPFVKQLYDVYFMEGLRKLLSWSVCLDKDWKLNVGKSGKWLKKYLTKDIYEEFISLYSSADYEEQWDKLLRSGSLIREIGQELADKMGYVYPLQDDQNVSDYIRRIKSLPCNAQSFDD
ncbi:aminoglycoside adenylyltransferase [Anaerocolumna sedimenticola]|uniref:Aminoglycoside adenylyltransferase n=1 Tax=Anaerocolumna sedimenticola TaxID=2696063 RepID=A0A6P1TRI7_9FIRM|nr:aminoglycoside 6-adenylyltransferase [Anaerocolumna sedimenticola]QHQ63554.1 aminoglycoside adenylyltransferase [Anaerocolumna sedimenticola]